MPDDHSFARRGTSVFNDPRYPSLAEIIERIGKLDTIGRHEKANLPSSCRRAAVLMGEQPALIPAHPRYIRDKLKRVHPAHHEISRKRLLNIRRDVLRALELAGVAKSWSYLAPLSEAWQAIWDQITVEEERWRLSRPFRMFSALDILPSELTRAYWTMFREALRQEEENGAIESATRTYRHACKAYDAVSKIIPELPRLDVLEPRLRRGYTFKLSDFPDSFRSDYQRWLSNLSPDEADDIFSAGVSRRPIRVKTVEHMAFRIVQFASAIVLRGHKRIEEITSLAVLAEIEAYKAGLRWFVERLGAKESNLRLAQMVCSMARHHLAPREPSDRTDLAAQQGYAQSLVAHERHIRTLGGLISARVGKKQSGISEKNERRLCQFDDPANVDTFLDLPKTFTNAARKLPKGHCRAPVLMQAAVMAEVLIMCPIRVSNLAAITMSRHINRTRAGDGIAHLMFPGYEVKSDKELVFELPAKFLALIDAYIATWRPELVEQPSDWLFPGRKDTHKKAEVISMQLPALIWEYSGLEINVHLFRAITIDIYAEEHPEDVETPTQVLGHKDPNSIRYYRRLKTRAATKRFAKVMLARRHRTPKPGDAQ